MGNIFGKSFIELAPIVKEFYSWTLVRRSLTMKQIASQNKWRHDIQHDNNGYNDIQYSIKIRRSAQEDSI